MRQENANGIWVCAWEIERENGELTFLSKTQIGYLEFLDENYSPACECWDYMLKAQRELAEAEAALAKGWGRPQVLKGRIRAAKKLIGLIQKRVIAAIERLELDDVAEVLASDCEQDYKLLVLERLSEMTAPAE